MLESLNKLLKTEFEKALFVEAINNLHADSKIRFSNFAFVVRELIDTILKTRANDEDVKICIWHEEPINVARKVTRSQRLRYIIYGGFNKNIFDKIVSFNFECEIDKINRYFRDELSKHVHINEACLKYTTSDIEQKIKDFENIINNFLDMIDAAKARILNFLINRIEGIVTDKFISQTIDDLDILSTHTRVEHCENIEIEIERIESTKVIGIIYGNVCVSLQYGSDRDVIDGTGDVFEDDYPFKIPFYIEIEPLNLIFDDIENEDLSDLNSILSTFQITMEENIHFDIDNVIIDTKSFYE